MNLEKVIFGAFVILSCTLNFGFFIGDITDPAQHHSFELGATLVVNLIAMTLKFGDRTHIGAVHLATSIVAVLQLVASAVVWIWATRVSGPAFRGRGHGDRRIPRRGSAGCQFHLGRAADRRNAETRALTRTATRRRAGAMSDIQLMILRRMRLPLVVVIVAYAIAVFGLTLMPGTDPEGRPWHLSLFDAFYVMSYTATTIGFGEVPYPYSYAQRLWMTFSIYLTVISWAYALGVIFALTRQPAFRAALERSRFEAGVSRLVDRFFVICGHGQSGQRLVVALDRLGYATVVIEPNPERLRSLLVRDHAQPAVGMVGDARSPDLLEAAGIRRDNCRGVVVLTADDEATQTIAIETRVLAPQLPVLARVKSPIAQQTLEDFGGVTLVNPFETFAFNFALALDKPDTLRLEEWLTGVPGAGCPPHIGVPRGHWVLAGYGRFGIAVRDRLEQAGLTWKAIDLDPIRCGADGILGSGLAAEALKVAGIESACGLVAGTDNDANNLAIVMAARRLKPRCSS